MSYEKLLLECRGKKDDGQACGHMFVPEDTPQLYPLESDGATPDCKYQELMRGTCPKCQRREYAWLEIDDMGQVLSYHHISPKRHAHWDYRVEKNPKELSDRLKASRVRGSDLVKPWCLRWTFVA